MTIAVILAGGLGTRISEESSLRPKPMIEIGGMPILWHIMKLYSYHGISDFLICCGYKGYVIKEYFANYFLHMSDVTFDMSTNEMTVLQRNAESWRVTLIDTGEDTQTGGRLKRIKNYITDPYFCLTYGDGVGDVNITEVIAFHLKHGKEATMTAVQPPGRWGSLDLSGSRVERFLEKPTGDGGWINGGFFVLNRCVFDRVAGDDTVFEKTPLESLARDKQLLAWQHRGFWQAMDTLRDKHQLEQLWLSNRAPWKLWDR
jgi:glucose-1-phosphate cytidylyltransferase